MKIYLAGIYAANFHRKSQAYARLTDRERSARDGVRFILESYHYVHKQGHVDRIRGDGIRIFLDSGAFSAFTQGITVDLEKYCEYIKRNLDIIEVVDGSICASVLDGIGDPLLTWQNQQAMEQRGVQPLPCFHYGEDEEYLKWYIEHYPYITLGGMVPISNPQLFHWLDRIWGKYLTKSDGHPKLKVHGFGLTSRPMMKRYPWFSVDSSGWVQAALRGAIIIPGIDMIYVSKDSPNRKLAGAHLDSIAPPHRAHIVGELERAGFEIDRLQTIYLARWTYNMWFYTQENDQLIDKDLMFRAEQMELF